jgi:hypothetical protein
MGVRAALKITASFLLSVGISIPSSLTAVESAFYPR